jgi:DNA-directed RNA polymerase subunit beta'
MVNFFCNRPIDKGELKRLIAWFLVTNGSVQTTKMVGKLKTLGFHYATHAGISIGLEDLKIPPAKKLLLAYANKEISQTEQRFLRGKISAVERSQTLIDVWNATRKIINNVKLPARKSELPILLR